MNKSDLINEEDGTVLIFEFSKEYIAYNKEKLTSQFTEEFIKLTFKNVGYNPINEKLSIQGTIDSISIVIGNLIAGYIHKHFESDISST